MSGIKLYFKYFSIHLRSVMQYKTSFLMTVFGQFLTSFASFLSVFILMNRFSSVYEFTIYEVLLCYSAVLMSFSLAECFFRGFDSFASIIGNGEFERMLTRPRSLVLQVVGSKIEFSRIGRLIQAAVILCFVIPMSGIDWNFIKALTLVLMIAGGTLVFAGLFVIYGQDNRRSLSKWRGRTHRGWRAPLKSFRRTRGRLGCPCRLFSKYRSR